MSGPKRSEARPNVKGAALQAHLLTQLEAHPDLRREEHCRLCKEAHGIEVSPASITRARQALGWTRKKTIRASEHKEAERADGRHCSSSLASSSRTTISPFEARG